MTWTARPRAVLNESRWGGARRDVVRLAPRACRPRSLAMACLLLGAPAVVAAGDAARSDVVVTTRIVMASNQGKANLQGADTAPLRESLRLFPYSSYRLLQHEVRPVTMSKMVEFPVPGERHLLVQPTEYKNGRVALHVMLMEGRKVLVNTALKLKNGGEFVVAGPHHEDGVLFLAIGAEMAEKRQLDPNGLRRASDSR